MVEPAHRVRQLAGPQGSVLAVLLRERRFAHLCGHDQRSGFELLDGVLDNHRLAGGERQGPGVRAELPPEGLLARLSRLPGVLVSRAVRREDADARHDIAACVTEIVVSGGYEQLLRPRG